MLKGGDGKWRTMANEKLYASQKLIGAIYRVELAREVKKLGYGIEKTHADGRFEIAGVSRKVVEAFSTRRAAIVAAMNDRGLGDPESNPRLAERAALMTRAHKRDVDHEGLRAHWEKQAEVLDFDAKALARETLSRDARPRPAQAHGANEQDAKARATKAEATRWPTALAGGEADSRAAATAVPDGAAVSRGNVTPTSEGVPHDGACGAVRQAMVWGGRARVGTRSGVFQNGPAWRRRWRGSRAR